jgi:repressor LexA|nr:MAG TPA: Repressor protein CI [Caudoviricetes sp.]
MTEEIRNIVKRLKESILKSGYSYAELEKLTGISRSSLQRYANGVTAKIPIDAIQIIAKAVDVEAEYILGWDDKSNPTNIKKQQDEQATPLPQTNVFMRPVYDSISAGFGAVAQDVPVDYMPTYITCPSEQDKYIWINVHGDSMSPLIDDGSKILIKKQTSVDSGQIAAVLVDDEEAVVKKVLYNDNTVELHSVNPYYPPRVFKNNDVTRVQILGLVKEVSKSLQ